MTNKQEPKSYKYCYMCGAKLEDTVFAITFPEECLCELHKAFETVAKEFQACVPQIERWLRSPVGTHWVRNIQGVSLEVWLKS